MNPCQSAHHSTQEVFQNLSPLRTKEIASWEPYIRILLGIDNLPTKPSLEFDELRERIQFPGYYNGIPISNNRRKLQEMQKKLKVFSTTYNKVLSSLLEQSRLHNGNSTTEELRRQTIEQIRYLAKHRLTTVYKIAHKIDDPKMRDFIEKLCILNPSATTLWGVHYTLWSVSILSTGTQKHWDMYLSKSNSFEIMGCLMMTEMGHGSNPRALETTATYDPVKREFILNTPTLKAHKMFIGGAVQNASHAVIFAQLILDGHSQGVHAFAIQLRENGQLLPGISIHDLGRKRGLNGVDNGLIEFDQLRVPYDSLLDRYCEISEDGDYIAKNGNKDSHMLIYKLMSQFVRGRQMIALTSSTSLKFLTTVIYVYPPHGQGKDLHEKYVINKLSKTYALLFAEDIYLGENVNDHIPASLMKAMSSDMAMEECLETIPWYNTVHTLPIAKMIEEFRCDADASLTYEGVNELLMQLGAFGALKFIKNSVDKWKKDILVKWSAVGQVYDYFFPAQEPANLLKWEVFEIAQTLKNAMKGKNQNEMLNLWDLEYQKLGIHMAKMYGQMLMIEKFAAKAAELDKKQQTKVWGHLCEIYAWQAVSLLTRRKLPDLSESYEYVKKNIPELVAQLRIKLEWMDAMMPPPKLSTPRKAAL